MSLGLRCSAAGSRARTALGTSRPTGLALRHHLCTRPHVRILSQWSSRQTDSVLANPLQASNRSSLWSCTNTHLPSSHSLLPSSSIRTFHLTTPRLSQDQSPIPPPPSKLPSQQHENIYNIPNLLTLTRLISAPAIGYLIMHSELRLALGLFIYAGVTDLLDGWLARRYKLQTVVGSVIDPMADKLLMTIMTVSLAVKGLLPGMLPSFPILPPF